MSIRLKLLCGFLAVSLLGVSLGCTGMFSSYLFTKTTTDLRELTTQEIEFTQILAAHYNWRNGLSESVISGVPFTGTMDPTACTLGKWLNSDSAKNLTDPQLIDMVTKITAPHNSLHRDAAKVVSYLEDDEHDLASIELGENIIPKFQEVITILIGISDRLAQQVDERQLEAMASAKKTTRILIFLVVIVLVVSIFLALNISHKVSDPLVAMSSFFTKAGTTGDISLSKKELDYIENLAKRSCEIGKLSTGAAYFLQHVNRSAQTLETIAEGHLNVQFDLLSNQDTMGLSLKKMVNNLNSMITEIDSTAELVSTGAKQVAEGSQNLAQGSNEQAASIEQLSGTITEVTNMARENTKAATTAMEEVEKAGALMDVCMEQMDQMLVAMRTIDEKSNDISKTTKVIDEIAFQTNILALNAAVEAARAGQHGKGFAVVAEEVRNLAAKSAEAAKETGDLIESSTASVAEGGRIVEKVSGSLQMVSDISGKQAELITNIQSYSVHQSNSMEQISDSIEQVGQVVQQNSATAEESAASAEEMSSQSAMLKEFTSKFKLV